MTSELEFLDKVISTPSGYFCLATLRNGSWREFWFHWPEQKEEIVAAALQHREDGSVYFTAHLFSEKKSTRSSVLPSRTVQADLDYAAVPIDIPPTVLIETSPDRHQGYWVLQNEPTSIEQLENMSRGLTYSIPECDRGCWQLGHKMRFPNTQNFKYPSRPEIKVISISLTQVKSLPVATLTQIKLAAKDEEWEVTPQELSPLQLLKTVKEKIPASVYRNYTRPQEDRSKAQYALMMACFRAGMDRDEVYHIAKASVNNKFRDLKYNEDKDLKADVLRAERDSKKSSSANIIEELDKIRRTKEPIAVKRMNIANLIRFDLSRKGKLISTTDGEYFIRADNGFPIGVARRSPWLDSYLEDRYRLNRTEQEQHYVCAYLESWIKEHGERGESAYLSYYNAESGVVLLRTGQKEVLEIGRDRINIVPNGTYGIVFPNKPNEEPFELSDKTVPFETIFDGCFDNVIDLTEQEARALLRAWFMFLFFRDSDISRPILALFGQPGAGKSTLFRRVYRLLYGRNKSVNSLTSPEDFDHATSNVPLVVFDNVDTFSNWLPDKLALAASTSDLDKRKLYTDTDTVIVKRQALVGITAHSPKFRREDIVDRLIILNFQRLQHFVPETDILLKIWQNRDKIWASLVKDIQAILREPYPDEKDVPKFRISDFARAGLWIARALGFEDAFKSGLARNIQEQVQFNLEEESMLVDALKLWLRKNATREDQWVTVGKLYSDLTLIAPEEFSRVYPRVLSLSRKLWALQDTLKSVFKVEFQMNTKSGQREWRFSNYGKDE